MWCYICLSCQFIRNPPPELQIDWFYWFYWFYWLSHPNIHLTLKVQHVRTASTSCCRQTADICATSKLMFVHVLLIFLFLNRFWRIAPFKGVDSRDWLGWWNTDTRWHKRSDSIGWQEWFYWLTGATTSVCSSLLLFPNVTWSFLLS